MPSGLNVGFHTPSRFSITALPSTYRANFPSRRTLAAARSPAGENTTGHAISKESSHTLPSTAIWNRLLFWLPRAAACLPSGDRTRSVTDGKRQFHGVALQATVKAP